jgi:hypothetical protein
MLDDAGSGVGQRVGRRRAILRRRDPVHGGEAADEIEISDLQPPEREVIEVRPVAGALVAGEVGSARRAEVRLRHTRRGAHQREPPGRQWITGPAGLGDQQTGARVGFEVLRVHRHRADQEDRPTVDVERIGHDRRKRMPRMAARECGEAPRATKIGQRPCTLGKGRLRNGRRVGSPRRSRVTVHAAKLTLASR